jgi:homoserine kinase
MQARAPASSANLGPGFDALAVALSIYVTVRVEPADRLSVTSTGEGAELPADATHLAARVATEVAGHDRLAIHVESDIPVARGLGSSAALAVAAAAAAGAANPIEQGMTVDGHPENAAAAAHGGLVAAAVVEERPVVRRLPLDPRLRFVVVVPDLVLPTAETRRVLPATVTYADAVFNLGRMGLLVAGLSDHRQLVAAAAEDRLHQPARTRLFPPAPAILSALQDGGALMSCWSGAGSSLLAVCVAGTERAVAAAGERALVATGVPGRVLAAEADPVGITVSPGPAD